MNLVLVANSLVMTVFSGLSALVVEDVLDGSGSVVVMARTRDAAVPCPACRTLTAKVHGYHHRTVADVPVDGRPDVASLRVRRLVCLAMGLSASDFSRTGPRTAGAPSAPHGAACLADIPGRWRGSYAADRLHASLASSSRPCPAAPHCAIYGACRYRRRRSRG